MPRSANAKITEVKSQKLIPGHTCHWPGCKIAVAPALWGCRAHWYSLPKNLREQIWQTYRPGQEIDKQPSKEYLRAARRVQRWIADKIATTQEN